MSAGARLGSAPTALRPRSTSLPTPSPIMSFTASRERPGDALLGEEAVERLGEVPGAVDQGAVKIEQDRLDRHRRRHAESHNTERTGTPRVTRASISCIASPVWKGVSTITSASPMRIT